MAEDIILQIGTDYPITEKIAHARELFSIFGHQLLRDRNISKLLEEYHDAVKHTWEVMEQTGVCAFCTRCAIEDGGSCCGDGIENKFDAILLLINLLLGCDLPERRQIDCGCWFLGDTGCRLIARHVICVNYMCKALSDSLSSSDRQLLADAMLQETDLVFLIEEKIKRWIQTQR